MSQDAEGQNRTHLKTNRNNMTNMMTFFLIPHHSTHVLSVKANAKEIYLFAIVFTFSYVLDGN